MVVSFILSVGVSLANYRNLPLTEPTENSFSRIAGNSEQKVSLERLAQHRLESSSHQSCTPTACTDNQCSIDNLPKAPISFGWSDLQALHRLLLVITEPPRSLFSDHRYHGSVQECLQSAMWKQPGKIMRGPQECHVYLEQMQADFSSSCTRWSMQSNITVQVV